MTELQDGRAIRQQSIYSENKMKLIETAIEVINEIGDINEAIAHAAELSELAEYEVVYYGQEISFEEKLVSELLKNAGVSIHTPEIFSAVDGMLKFYESLIDISNPEVLLTCANCALELN